MTGVNAFLFYKDIFLSSSYSVVSTVFMCAPLLGGVLTFIFSSVDQGSLSFYGFLLIGLFESIFFLLFQFGFKEIAGKTLPFAIVVLINFTLSPLLGVLPQYLKRESTKLFGVYRVIGQLSNFFGYWILSTLYRLLSLNFILICSGCSILGGILTYFLLIKKSKA